jgi:beta-glucosidase
LAPDAVETFLRFTAHVVEGLGDLVDEWCTINEPNVFVNETYMDGHHPGGRVNDLAGCLKAATNLIRAHWGAYELIHRLRGAKGLSGTKVGFAHHLAVFEPATWGARLGTWFSNHLFHEIFWKGFVEGRLVFPLAGGKAPGHGPYCDFVGINYYSRHLFRVNGNPATLFAGPTVDPAVPAERLNDLGWEIYPSGLFQVVKAAWDRYRLPVFITENGIADARDEKRERYLRDHLAEVKRLLDAGVDVQRYCHWSFTDNFEWQQGYSPRFGLVEVDYATMQRTVRPSGRFYAEICRTHRVPGDNE